LFRRLQGRRPEGMPKCDLEFRVVHASSSPPSESPV
jgi:hypothetical protein